MMMKEVSRTKTHPLRALKLVTDKLPSWMDRPDTSLIFRDLHFGSTNNATWFQLQFMTSADARLASNLLRDIEMNLHESRVRQQVLKEMSAGNVVKVGK